MKHRLAYLGAAAFALLLVACGDQITNVVVDSDQHQGGGNGGPGASPSPGASGQCRPADYVRVGFFGFAPGCASAPRNGEGVLPLGCTGHATATPKIAGGADQPSADHVGTTPRWEVTEGAASLQLLTQTNPFNADLSWRPGTTAGTVARVSVAVCGVVGGFEFVAR